jgi:hypothetical protein
LITHDTSTIFHDITEHAGLEEDTTATSDDTPLRPPSSAAGTDLVVVADLLGHARLDTVRTYTRPTTEALTHYPPTADQPILQPTIPITCISTLLGQCLSQATLWVHEL